jgi:2-isopropylmalate synthase
MKKMPGPSAPAVRLYDTTLRDGTQGEGVSLSVDDKLKIAVVGPAGRALHRGRLAGLEPQGRGIFQAGPRNLRIKNAKLSAFGSHAPQRRARSRKDPNLAAIVRVGTPVACIFGKSWDLHVTHALRATLDENLKMIGDSVRFLKSKGKEVVYDAEHFFDGYRANAEYALASCAPRFEAGADNLTLCDTNGGALFPTTSRKLSKTFVVIFPKRPWASIATTIPTRPWPIPWRRSATG